MKTNKTMTKTLLTVALGLALVAGSNTPADAGRGASARSVRRAIQSDVPSAIIGELEKAEYLWSAAVINDVMQLLDHGDYSVREVAAWWFARRPAQKKELAGSSLAYLLNDDSVKVRNAADVLGTFRDPNAIEGLSAAVLRTDIDADARVAVVRALGTIGHAAASPALATAMQDASAAVRVEAVNAWLEIRKQQDAAPVAALVNDDDALVRRAAASVVGNFRDSSGRVALETRLASDSDPAVRRNAAWALGRIGDPASRSALEAARTDESGLVRGVARAAVAELR